MAQLSTAIRSITSDNSAVLPVRAISIDLARSMRADEAALERMIRNASECGLNMVVFYLEHRFEFPSCPGIGPAGSMTPDMAKRLVSLGQSLGVEVVPGINLIGHCEGISAIERYAHLSVDPYDHAPWGAHEQLNLELPEARELVTRMLADIHAAFPGQWIYMGGDEVRRMPFLFPNDQPRQLEAIIRQFQFMLELGLNTGRHVMITADMVKHYPQLLQSLPREVILIDWYYGNDAKGIISPRLTEAGFNVLMMPTIDSHCCFSTRPAAIHENLDLVVTHARQSQLSGFMAAIWECMAGVTIDLCWPWAALACKLADEPVQDPRAFVSQWAATRYGVDGQVFLGLHEMLGDELRDLIYRHGNAVVLISRLRKSLFRGADVFEGYARAAKLPQNAHIRMWEPSPFHTWLMLRPVLNDAFISELRTLADRAKVLAQKLKATCQQKQEELVSLLGLSIATEVMVDRLEILRDAQLSYRKAAMAQQDNSLTFKKAMKQTADHLRQLQPGIERLQLIVRDNDQNAGVDASEHRWLELHLKSLTEHVEVLEQYESTDDALLDFGEFLRRPASISVRVHWR